MPEKTETELSGFDEDLFVANSFANDRTLVSLLEEFRIVRQTSIIFFENLQNVALTNTGKANGNEISVETIGRLIVGHNFHHLKIVEERYLPEVEINFSTDYTDIHQKNLNLYNP